jgi:hypothetical protein
MKPPGSAMTHSSKADLGSFWFVVENGGIVRFQLTNQDLHRGLCSEAPLLVVSYEGPPPERELDYFEASIFEMDGNTFVGSHSIDDNDLPELRFHNLSDDVSEAISERVKKELEHFIRRNRRRLIKLAQRTRRP